LFFQQATDARTNFNRIARFGLGDEIFGNGGGPGCDLGRCLLRRERDCFSTPTERQREAAENGEVGVKLHLRHTAHPKRRQTVVSLEICERRLDCAATRVEVAEPLRVARDTRHQSRGAFDGRKDKLLAASALERDHGVDAEFVAALDRAGYRDLEEEDLVRVRDHGVDPEFIASLDRAGYQHLTLERLVRLRDHGVDADYIADMKEAGYRPADPEELVESRDHGVDPHYVKSLKEAGYDQLSLSDLRRARDHGVTKSFILRVKDRVRGELSLSEIIRMRDRGETR
jgi:hypothetical protein